MFVYVHTKCSSFTDWMVWMALKIHQMDKKESNLMGLVAFKGPVRGEPSIHLKFENVNIENESVAVENVFNFLNLAFQNGKMDRE